MSWRETRAGTNLDQPRAEIAAAAAQATDINGQPRGYSPMGFPVFAIRSYSFSKSTNEFPLVSIELPGIETGSQLQHSSCLLQDNGLPPA
jgi:hypothetical protein